MRQNGAAIRILRQLRGIKVVRMSEQLGCHRSTVLRIESERTRVSKETLQAIAELLDVPVAAIDREEKAVASKSKEAAVGHSDVAVDDGDDDVDGTGVSSKEIRHYTIAEAAVQLGIGKRTLAGHVAAGKVPHTRPFNGRLVFFRRDHLLAISRAGDVLPTRRSA